MKDTEEQEYEGLDVKFYPFRNKYVERSVVELSRLIKVILFLCMIISAIVVADFLGYAFEDIKSFFAGKNGEAFVENAEHEIERAMPAVGVQSMYAGHSYAADSVGQMHNRSTLQEMLTDQGQDSQATQDGYFGVDVSHWQHTIQWDEISSDSLPQKIDFSIIKATQGDSWIDPDFSHNWQQSNKFLQISGAYHYYIFSDDPETQADNFIKTVSLSNGNLPPIVDVELVCSTCDSLTVTRDKMMEDLTTFLEAIENHFSVKPIIYTNTFFYTRYLAGKFEDYTFWMAEYEKTPPQGLVGIQPQASDTTNIPNIVIWQFTDYDRLKGIIGRVDMNFMPEQARNTIQFVTQ